MAADRLPPTTGTVVASTARRRPSARQDPLALRRNKDTATVRRRADRTTRIVFGRGARRRRAGVEWLRPSPHAPDATSRSLCGLYPFLAPATAANGDGIVQGVDVLTGGAFMWDAFANYATGAESNPSFLLIGEVGSRKSSMLKCHANRALTLGRHVYIVDPKGEYAALAAAVGGQVVRLAPGNSGVTLCPLITGADVHAVNVGMIGAIVAVLAGRSLDETEQRIVSSAVAILTEFDAETQCSRRQASLGEIYELIRRPSAQLLDAVERDATTFAGSSRNLVDLLWRVCDRASGGELVGMIDGHSTSLASSSLTVLDVSAVYARREAASQAFRLAMLCGLAWVQGEVLRRRVPSYLVLDEAWGVLGDADSARFTHDNIKLSRQHGLSVMMAMHRLSDLRVGNVGSEHHNRVTALLSDVGTVVAYRQAFGERELLAAWLKMPPGQIAIVTDPATPKGRGLWRFGKHVHLVDHRLTAAELAFCDTDAAMRGPVSWGPPKGLPVEFEVPERRR